MAQKEKSKCLRKERIVRYEMLETDRKLFSIIRTLMDRDVAGHSIEGLCNAPISGW
jgi:hypothetical protein